MACRICISVDSQYAYKGEVRALLLRLLLHVILALETKLQCTTTSSAVADSDCMSALPQFFSLSEYVNPDFNPLRYIINCKRYSKGSQMCPSVVHLWGTNPSTWYENILNSNELLNIQMNYLAKHIIQLLLQYAPSAYQLPTTLHEGVKITSNIVRTLLQCINTLATWGNTLKGVPK